MDSIEKLKRLQDKMNEVLNHLSHVNDNLTKVLENNASAINVNTNTYKSKEILNTKNKLAEQMRIIKHNILPSLENEIRELEMLEN